MYIKRVIMENFKCFSEKTEIEFSFPNWKINWLNIFIWENNTWKSTVFESINFLFDWLPTWKDINDLKNKNKLEEDVIIELEFVWNLREVLSESKYKNYISDDKWTQIIKLRRTSRNEKIIQWKKEVVIDEKKLCFWNIENNRYENLTGLDKVIKGFFDIDFIWADTLPNDIAKYWSSTIVWKLVSRISQWFKDTNKYKKFEIDYNKVFNEWEDSLKSKLKETWSSISSVFKEQFWDADINFHFEKLDINDFFKKTKIEINDWTKTLLDEKWSWMQRAVALALLQVYISTISEDPEKEKPFYFFIDEPEISLHPKAQIKLAKALNKISETQQIFLTTHSPYFFKNLSWKNSSLFIFKRNENDNIIIENIGSTLWWIFWKYSPTWWEINYYAYDLPTIEFHNELYWYLEANKKTELKELPKTKRYLNARKLKWNETEKQKDELRESISIQEYIRHLIHHPENKHNDDYTEEELRESIKGMIAIAKKEFSYTIKKEEE